MLLGRLGGLLRRLSGVRGLRLTLLCRPLLRHPYLGTMRPGRRVLSPIWSHHPPQLAGGGPPNRRHPPAGASRGRIQRRLWVRPRRCLSRDSRCGFAALTSGLIGCQRGCGRLRITRAIGQVPALPQRGGEAMAEVAAGG